MRTRIFLLSFFLSSGINLKCQAQGFEKIKNSLKVKPEFFLTLASFNTFIDHDFASFDGIRAGLNYDQTVKFGLGYFVLANNGVVSTINVEETGNNYSTNGQLELFFFSTSAEYLFYNEFPWQFSVVPFNLAFGSAHYEYISRAEKKRVSGPSEFIMLYQPDITAQYNVLSWFGFGISTGYRIALLRSRQQTRNLDGFNFSIDFRISVDELYDEITGEN